MLGMGSSVIKDLLKLYYLKIVDKKQFVVQLSVMLLKIGRNAIKRGGGSDMRCLKKTVSSRGSVSTVALSRMP